MKAKFALCLVCGASAVFGLAGCRSQPFTNDARPYFRTAVLRGSASYTQRIALAPGSVLKAELVELTGLHPQTVAQTQVVTSTQPPIDFEIPYDPDAIDAGGRYGVVATITPPESTTPMWTTAAPVPVVPLRRGDQVSLPLVRAKSESGAP